MSRWNPRNKLLALAGGLVCALSVALLLSPRVAPATARAGDPKADEKKPATLSADKIGAASGAKATTTPDGVVRIGWPRSDVAVTVDGMPLKPFAGLGSWAAFAPAKHGAMVMGDTVVFQDEAGPAMDAAFAGGLEVTGLHNHFFHDEPKAYFMHIGGAGDPEKLAIAVKNVWDAIKQVRAKSPQPATRFAGEIPKEGTISAARIDAILGHKSQSQDGEIGRASCRERV